MNKKYRLDYNKKQPSVKITDGCFNFSFYYFFI